MAGAANRCVIPEYKFDIEKLTELLVHDRRRIRAVFDALVSERGDVCRRGR